MNTMILIFTMLIGLVMALVIGWFIFAEYRTAHRVKTGQTDDDQYWFI
jgi:hypothetical protein